MNHLIFLYRIAKIMDEGYNKDNIHENIGKPSLDEFIETFKQCIYLLKEIKKSGLNGNDYMKSGLFQPKMKYLNLFSCIINRPNTITQSGYLISEAEDTLKCLKIMK